MTQPKTATRKSSARHTISETEQTKELIVRIPPPQLVIARFHLLGTTPYVQNKFTAKAKFEMMRKQEAGSQSNARKIRTPKDFEELYRQSTHVATDGWYGLPATGFRAAMISACRLVGFKMTLAKLSIEILADGYDRDDSTPLVKILEGKPERIDTPMPNDNGNYDIRSRPMWSAGWKADLRVRFDEGQFSLEDVANLLKRVGQQVGIGAGRPDSKNSAGCGWGLFTIDGMDVIQMGGKA